MMRNSGKREGGVHKLVVKIPQINEEIQLRILLMALGCNNNRQMLQRIMLEDNNPIYEKELIPSLESQDDGIESQA
jgi:hypothetical protein